MLEGYKDISRHISARYRLTFEPETIRGWKYKYNLPVQRARKGVHILSDEFEKWFERVILQRAATG